MFGQPSTFRCFTVAAGFIIAPALSRIYSGANYLFATRHIFYTVDEPPDSIGWYVVMGQVAMNPVLLLKPVGLNIVPFLHMGTRITSFTKFKVFAMIRAPFLVIVLASL